MNIQQLIDTPMDKLKFKNFLGLKCGMDEYSRIRLPQLLARIDERSADQITTEFEAEKERASCIRWILRGLPLGKAIRKVKTDSEVSANAAARLHRGNFNGWAE